MSMRNRKVILNAAIIPGLLLLVNYSQAQATDSLPRKISFSVYLEPYYGYDLSRPADHNRPSYLYSYNRHNEFNLNLGMLKAGFADQRVRANLAIATGTYMNANLAAEPGVLRNLLEANAGIKLSASRELWLDAGILPSHIGFESAIGKDCPTLTRSLQAENSPYYESGVRFSYSSGNGRWYAAALILNGWQRIKRPDGNNSLAFGHQLTWRPSDGVTLNASSFIGNDKPDSSRQYRYFHNLYGIFGLQPKLQLTMGFDIGMEQSARGSRAYHSWYSPVLILRYQSGENAYLSGRLEQYRDEHGVIIDGETEPGFNTWGASLNYDRSFHRNLLWRLEARYLSAYDPFFTTSLALSF